MSRLNGYTRRELWTLGAILVLAVVATLGFWWLIYALVAP